MIASIGLKLIKCDLDNDLIQKPQVLSDGQAAYALWNFAVPGASNEQ